MNHQRVFTSRRWFFTCDAAARFSAITLLSLFTLVPAGKSLLLAASNDSSKAASWRIAIASKDEPGEPLIVSGVFYGSDGVTPLPGVVIYVYHTDAEGYYRKGNNSSSNPRLKGWMKTNAEGKYEFRTIKPGSYPGSRNPAHVHVKVTVPGRPEQWADEFHCARLWKPRPSRGWNIFGRTLNYFCGWRKWHEKR